MKKFDDLWVSSTNNPETLSLAGTKAVINEMKEKNTIAHCWEIGKKLFDILKMKKIKSSYEKCIRACVIVKYCPKIKNKEEKEVSLFVFEKGNIIITGARNLEHIIESYNYMNNIIIEHIDEIIKKNEDNENKLILELYDDIMESHSHKLKNIDI